MDITKYKEGTNLNNNEHHKRTGLLNVGSTCYINTLIQCLISCPVFREFIISKDYFNRINNETELYLIKELQSIFESMWIDGSDGYGSLKIIDTPLGQIVKTLLQSGAKLGVSSRGSGSVDDAGAVSDFDIVTVDIVYIIKMK